MMIPRWIIRKVATEAGGDFAGLGMVVNGDPTIFHFSDDIQVQRIGHLLNTMAPQTYRRFFLSLSPTRLSHVECPLGFIWFYWPLDAIIGGPAGVFVLEEIPARSLTSIRNHPIIQQLGRRDKKSVCNTCENLTPWRHPESDKIEYVLTSIEQRMHQYATEFRENALQNALLEYKDFVASFSHEALGPIQEIRNVLEFTLSHEALSESIELQLQSSIRSIDRFRVSLEGMRLLFRNEEIPRRNQFRTLDSRIIISRWCEHFAPQFYDKYIDVILEPRYGPWNLHIVPEYFEVLVRNLISNASKYSFNSTGNDKPGKFVVRFSSSEPSLHFVNFGVPISKEEVETERIFEPGQRGELSDDRGRVGKGMGLFLVRKIMKLHGGTCTVKSEIRNPGGVNEFAQNEFIVTFPLKGGL